MPWIASQVVDLQVNCSTHEVQRQKNSIATYISCFWHHPQKTICTKKAIRIRFSYKSTPVKVDNTLWDTNKYYLESLEVEHQQWASGAVDRSSQCKLSRGFSIVFDERNRCQLLAEFLQHYDARQQRDVTGTATHKHVTSSFDTIMKY